MAVREVAPFDEKQWKQLEEMMFRGSTKKQLKAIADAKERIKNIKVEF